MNLNEPSLWLFITHANGVVKGVMLILLLASIASWTLIFQRTQLLRKTKKLNKKFEERFWSGVALDALYEKGKDNHSSMETIFRAGFKEYKLLNQQRGHNPAVLLEGVERALRIAHAQEIEQLQNHYSFLATVGSTSPYIGLFGTVWGIMSAFRALGNVQQATIALVAPGISEALIATAMGLFAAIPAVIAYNRFSHQIEQISTQLDIFEEAFINILHRQIYTTHHAEKQDLPLYA